MSTRGTSVVIQPFIKADTVERLLHSLLRCALRESVRLVLFSDTPNGFAAENDAKRAARLHEFAEKNRRVMAILAEFRDAHAREFRDVVVVWNDRHLGPYGTCKAAIDFALESDDYVIFAEDDAVFSSDALEWYQRIYESGISDAADNWAVTGESIYFDGKSVRPPAEYVARAKAACIRRGYFHQHTRFKHVPATSFAVTKPKWDLFGAVRGAHLGDVNVCKLFQEQRKFAIFPILARVKNDSMLHADGHAMSTLGRDAVLERGMFNTYLTSEDVLGAVDRSAPYVRFTGSWAKLHDESVKLKGFDEHE